MAENPPRTRPPLRVVFDTVGFVRALLKPSGPWGALVFEQFSKYVLLMSAPLRAEILEVFERSDVSRKVEPLDFVTIQEIRRLIDNAPIIGLSAVPAISRDPTDDMVIATAVTGGADYLVTEDKDLLVLGSVEGVQIMTGIDFLRFLRKL